MIAKYHDLWHVERSIRISKSDLRSHSTRNAIEARPTIVFTALAAAHNMQERTGLAIAKVIKRLRPLLTAIIAISPPEIPASQQTILASLDIPETGALSVMS